jgi:hypothetical protein
VNVTALTKGGAHDIAPSDRCRGRRRFGHSRSKPELTLFVRTEVLRPLREWRRKTGERAATQSLENRYLNQLASKIVDAVIERGIHPHFAETMRRFLVDQARRELEERPRWQGPDQPRGAA